MAATRKIKSFAATVEEETVVDAIPLEIAGVELEALGEVPGVVLLDFIADSSTESSADTAKAILSYLTSSFDEENLKTFNSIVRDPKKRIKIEVLSEIVGYLVEERSSRPTEAS